MKKATKFLALVLVFAMVLGTFAGCSKDSGNDKANEATNAPAQSGSNNSSTDNGNDNGDAAVDQEAINQEAEALGLPAMTTDEITLTYACWGLGENGEVEARDKQLEAFQKAYPNIHVEFVNIDQGAWDDGLTSLAATNSLPDVFWVFSVTNAVANEWALDVTDYYLNDPDAKEVYTSMIDTSMIGGKLYSMPGVMFPCMIFLNKTMFDNYNEPLPSYDWTLDDYKAIAERITHPEDFYFGTSNPIFGDYFPALYYGESQYGWDGEGYHFDQSWIDGWDLRYNYIDSGVCEWASEEDKLRFLGDAGAWPPGFGRSAMHWDWTWTISFFEDVVKSQSGCDFLYYPQPKGESGAQMAIVDYSVISAATEHPREAWELQKWTSWGKDACLNRYEGYKQAGLVAVSRMPVTSNAEAWDAVKGFTDREDIKAVYDHLTNVVPTVNSVAPGFNQFNDWMNENDIWGQLDRREISPDDIAADLTTKANEFRDEWLNNFAH